MKPISGNRVTAPQSAGPIDTARMSPAHPAKGRWDLGCGSFKMHAGNHSCSQDLVSGVCPEMPALPPDQCAEKLVADAKIALRRADIDVS